MNMKKHHHTIPRCYLKNFSDKDGFIWTLDRNGKIFRVKPKNILVENHFYTITLKSGKKSLFVEDALANIEGAYTDIFRDRISKDQFLTEDERAKVSIFIAALLLRTKPYRESLRRMFQKLKDNIEKWKKHLKIMNSKVRKTISAMPPSSGETINLKDIKQYLNRPNEQHSVGVIINLPKISQLIFNMKWAVFRNTTCGFVTSDNPVVVMRPASIRKYGPNTIGSRPGLLYKDAELTIPLSKDRLLLAGWILERDSYLTIEDIWADSLNHRTIIHSSERIITDSRAKAEAIKFKIYRDSL